MDMLKGRFLLSFLLCVALAPNPAFAWHGHGRTFVGLNVDLSPGAYYYGYPYDPYYYGGPYYYPPYPVVGPPMAVTAPAYQPVLINGTTYYVNNGSYYLYTPYGYQAVPAPAAAVIPAAQAPQTVANAESSFTVNVPNAKGGYTAVIITRSSTGFIGPQGEFYAQFPKVSQLQVMYGKS